ncbi:MAG: DUF6975 family protein [Allosphingosinicella sp.]|uniref:DUF6975 family protein n=1 Tax=Allosphingosinicella sp. TaxID=2823234 RepID=UPI00393E3F50
MASSTVERARAGAGIGRRLLGLAAARGSAAHPWFASAALLQGAGAARNLADAVHLLCTLHGRHPGVIDLAVGRTPDAASRAWLEESAEAFVVERLYLTRLAVAAGPIPGTPGGAATEAAVTAQRSGLGTLASSERNGCALGAALALAADWSAIRSVLDTAGRRLGVEPPAFRLSRDAELEAVAARAAQSPAVERALAFGFEQMLVQHHGLWDLIEARAEARAEG